MTLRAAKGNDVDWFEQHPDDLIKHAGPAVAIHPTRGIVAMMWSYGVWSVYV